MNKKTLTNKEKAALAAEVVELVATRAKNDFEQQQVTRMAIILLFGNCGRLTFE